MLWRTVRTEKLQQQKILYHSQWIRKTVHKIQNHVHTSFTFLAEKWTVEGVLRDMKDPKYPKFKVKLKTAFVLAIFHLGKDTVCFTSNWSLLFPKKFKHWRICTFVHNFVLKLIDFNQILIKHTITHANYEYKIHSLTRRAILSCMN